jgi:hypothetical protein
VKRRKKATEFHPAPAGTIAIVNETDGAIGLRLIFTLSVDVHGERITRAWLFQVASAVEARSVGEGWLVSVGHYGNGSELRIELVGEAKEADRAMRILRQVVGLPVKEEKQ